MNIVVHYNEFTRKLPDDLAKTIEEHVNKLLSLYPRIEKLIFKQAELEALKLEGVEDFRKLSLNIWLGYVPEQFANVPGIVYTFLYVPNIYTIHYVPLKAEWGHARTSLYLACLLLIIAIDGVEPILEKAMEIEALCRDVIDATGLDPVTLGVVPLFEDYGGHKCANAIDILNRYIWMVSSQLRDAREMLEKFLATFIALSDLSIAGASLYIKDIEEELRIHGV